VLFKNGIFPFVGLKEKESMNLGVLLLSLALVMTILEKLNLGQMSMKQNGEEPDPIENPSYMHTRPITIQQGVDIVSETRELDPSVVRFSTELI